MLVFWDENLVFLAVPKTGSTALENALAPRAAVVVRNPPELKHAPVYRYERFLANYFDTVTGKRFETMAVVREPISWLSSWYRYRHRDDLVGHPNSTRGITFDAFVREYWRGKSAPFANVGSQARFLAKGDSPAAVDHLFAYEDQDRINAFLQERLGTRFETKQANVSPTLATPLSPGVEAKLREKCAEEFAVWEMARGA